MAFRRMTRAAAATVERAVEGQPAVAVEMLLEAVAVATLLAAAAAVVGPRGRPRRFRPQYLVMVPPTRPCPRAGCRLWLTASGGY